MVEGIDSNTNIKNNSSGTISKLNDLRKESTEYDAFIKRAYDYIEKNVPLSKRDRCYKQLIMFITGIGFDAKVKSAFKQFLSNIDDDLLKKVIDGVSEGTIKRFDQLPTSKKSTNTSNSVKVLQKDTTPGKPGIESTDGRVAEVKLAGELDVTDQRADQAIKEMKEIEEMKEGPEKEKRANEWYEKYKDLDDKLLNQSLDKDIENIKDDHKKQKFRTRFRAILEKMKKMAQRASHGNISKYLKPEARAYFDKTILRLDKQIVALDISIKETEAILSREDEMQRNMMGIYQSAGSKRLEGTEGQEKDKEVITKERIEEFHKSKEAVRLLLDRFNAETAADKDLAEKSKEVSEFIAKIADKVMQLNETIMALSAKNLSDSKELMKILQSMIELVSDEKKNAEVVKDLKDLTLNVQKALKDAMDYLSRTGAAGKAQAAEMKDAIKALSALAKTVGELSRLFPALIALSKSVDKKDMEKLSEQLMAVSKTLVKTMEYVQKLLSFQELAHKGNAAGTLADGASNVQQVAAGATDYVKKLQRMAEGVPVQKFQSGARLQVEEAGDTTEKVRRKGDAKGLKNDLLGDVDELLDQMLDKLDPETVAKFVDKLPGYAKLFIKDLAQGKLDDVSKAISGNRPQTVDKIMGELKTYLPEVYLKIKATLEQHIQKIMSGPDKAMKEKILQLAKSSSEIGDIVAKIPQEDAVMKKAGAGTDI